MVVQVGTSVAGYVKAVGNLAFVVVLNSGHLVSVRHAWHLE